MLATNTNATDPDDVTDVPHRRETSDTELARPFVLACGALARELRAVLAADHLDAAVDIDYLPAPLHNRPERIVPAIDDRLAEIDPRRPVFLAYADCGTGGMLDDYIARSDRDITRLPGAHCYEFFAGADRFADLHDREPGTLYLTDFLAKHFEALIWEGLGLARHPELRDVYFANYRCVVLLSQSVDDDIAEIARAAAARLSLEFRHEPTGLEPFAAQVRVGLRSEVG